MFIFKILKRVLVVVIILMIIGAMYQYIATKLDEQKYPPIGKMIDVGGYKLHVIDTGIQKNIHDPIIVLESGMGCTTFDWLLVYPEIAKFARVIVYDRAGYGWSDASPLPRTSANIIQELHTMLATLGTSAPYILVGHSFGGMNARLFASKYPDEVVGMVLVDAMHEDVMLKIPQIFINFKNWVYKRLLAAYVGIPRMIADCISVYKRKPVDKNKLIDRAYKQTIRWYDALFEQLNLIAISCHQMKTADGLVPDIPLVVITAGKEVIPMEGPCGLYTRQQADIINENWLQLQADLVNKSSQGTQIIARNSGHMIPYEAPEIIIDAVHTMYDELKNEK